MTDAQKWTGALVDVAALALVALLARAHIVGSSEALVALTTIALGHSGVSVLHRLLPGGGGWGEPPTAPPPAVPTATTPAAASAGFLLAVGSLAVHAIRALWGARTGAIAVAAALSLGCGGSAGAGRWGGLRTPSQGTLRAVAEATAAGAEIAGAMCRELGGAAADCATRAELVRTASKTMRAAAASWDDSARRQYVCAARDAVDALDEAIVVARAAGVPRSRLDPLEAGLAAARWTAARIPADCTP